jgi:DNA-binding CsgD family transcriptional regulator
LLKIGLTTQEIGKLLYISARTVEQHRYHIRQKISLPSDANLNSFLACS